MTHSHFIRKTLGIKDKNIQFKEQISEETIKGQNHLVLYGKLTYTPKACTKCGSVNHSTEDVVKNGTKISTIKQTTRNEEEIKLYFISFVLSHSRYKYLEWLDRPFTTKDTIHSHENAFRYFGEWLKRWFMIKII